jgi:hypothetical protein
MFWIGLLIGTFVGALLGVFVMSMMALAKRTDERECVNLEDWDDEDWDEEDRRMTREQLPQRRYSQTFALEWGGYRSPHFVTCGFYEDGRLGEVFIGAGKSGEQVEAVARDGAILCPSPCSMARSCRSFRTRSRATAVMNRCRLSAR